LLLVIFLIGSHVFAEASLICWSSYL
jgi:hypothetical protein